MITIGHAAYSRPHPEWSFGEADIWTDRVAVGLGLTFLAH